jgi:subtilase family serine protease
MWTKGRPAEVSDSFACTVQFVRANQSALENSAVAISDPHSPRFRQFLSPAEVAELVKPLRQGAVEALEAHLERIDGCAFIIEAYAYGDYARVTATVGCFQKWLHAPMFVFSHAKKAGGSHHRIGSEHTPTIPKLLDFVQHIHGFTLLPIASTKPTSAKVAFGEGKEPGETVTPPVILKKYGVTVPTKSSESKTSQAVAAFEDAQFLQTDVDVFDGNYSITSPKWKVVGPNNGGYFGEASLDTQYLPATGQGIQSYFVSMENFDMLQWSLEVLNISSPPHVLSVSWGSGESGYEPSHTSAANDEFKKMATMGISIFTASGDAGTGKQGVFGCKKFDPTWPASSPWVTAVGGTYANAAEEENATVATGDEEGWKVKWRHVHHAHNPC